MAPPDAGRAAAEKGEALPDAAERSGRCARCCFSRCCSVTLFLVKLQLYFEFCGRAGTARVFLPLHNYQATCAHEPLPVNQSGVKVLIAGFAKMGTRTMSRTLYQLGYNHSYHGEDILYFVWHQIAADYWARPENGGLWTPRTGKVPIFADDEGSDDDLIVLRDTPPELLAARLSACRTDAIAFDGSEELFWPVFNVSQDAKVLVLNWRTFEEAAESMRNFGGLFIPFILAVADLHLGTNLGWNVVMHVLEPLAGKPILRLLQEGGPPFNQVAPPYETAYLRHFSNLRFSGHWFMGLGSAWQKMEKEHYDDFFATLDRRVPPEKRLDVNPRKTTYEDLCRFLEVDPCPRSGRLPRAINLGNQEFDFWPAFALCIPIWLVVHWVNWRVLRWLLGSAPVTAVRDGAWRLACWLAAVAEAECRRLRARARP